LEAPLKAAIAFPFLGAFQNSGKSARGAALPSGPDSAPLRGKKQPSKAA
jgi:hypothetical protein